MIIEFVHTNLSLGGEIKWQDDKKNNKLKKKLSLPVHLKAFLLAKKIVVCQHHFICINCYPGH